MKHQTLLIIALTAIFILSTLTFTAQAKVECPTCHGTGQITSQTCQACYGSGQIQPNVTKTQFQVGGGPKQTNVSKIYHNYESVNVYGVATATVNTQVKTLTETTNRTLFPANSDTLVIVSFDNLEYRNYYASTLDLVLESIECPACSGSGAGALVECQACGGTGFVEASVIGGFDFAGIAIPIVGVAVVGAVAGAGIVLLKKRRLSEDKIRTFTSFEFQKWVLERLHGTGASVLDSRKGIDGFTGDGAPVVARQQDNVGKIQIDAFLNSVMQAKAKRGVFVAFGFDREASASVIKGRINYRVDVKLITVKELLANKEAVL